MNKLFMFAASLILLCMSAVPMHAQDTPPTLSNFTFLNQGSCVAAQNPSGTLTMFHPGAAGVGFNWCVLANPLPASTQWTVITGLRGHLLGKAASLGFTLYDQISGKLIVYSIGVSDNGTASLAGWKMNSFTVYQTPSAPYFTFNNTMAIGGLLPKYLRIKDNGTYRTFAISADKEVWLTIHVAFNNDFMVPTHYGYSLRGTGDSLASIMTVYHESVTTP